MPLNFPLDIRFKILTLVPQLYVSDGAGQPFAYIRSRLFALKEDITVFADDTMAVPHYKINADRIIDFNASYSISEAATGHVLGSVRRRGARSLWRATYEIFVGDRLVFTVGEKSVLVRFLDLLLGEIPIVGLLTGYFLNPAYLVHREGASGEVIEMTKARSFLESTFKIAKTGTMSDDEQVVATLALMMIIFLERSRG